MWLSSAVTSHFSISVSPQLTTWSTSLWPEARNHRVVTGTTLNMRWVLTNQSAFLLTRHARSSWSLCCESWVTVRCQRSTPLWPGLRCPVCPVCCKHWQAVEGHPGSPAALGLSGLGPLAGLLVVLLPEASPRQRPEWSGPRLPSLPHSLPGEGRHRWRYHHNPAGSKAVVFIMVTWATEQTCFLSVCSQEAESGGRAARGQRQELRRLPHRQQEVQQQPLLLVLPCTHGRPTLLLHHRDFPHDRSTVSAEGGEEVTETCLCWCSVGLNLIVLQVFLAVSPRWTCDKEWHPCYM